MLKLMVAIISNKIQFKNVSEKYRPSSGHSDEPFNRFKGIFSQINSYI